jgi:Fe2+ transport system protein B
MTSLLSRFRDDMSDDLEAQVEKLQKEVRSLRKALASRRSNPWSSDMASDFYDEIASRLKDALPAMQRQSRVVHRAATDHPMTTAVIGLALLGLVAGLMTANRYQIGRDQK